MDEFEAFKDWLGPPLNLLFVPEWYWNWARILLAAGLPAALLGQPPAF
jgi:hypothetical protein